MIIHFIGNIQSKNTAEFAFGLPRRDIRKTLKRNTKLGAGIGALSGAAYSLKNSKSIKNAAIKGVGVAVLGSLAAAGTTGARELLKKKPTVKIGKKTYSYSYSG